MLYEQKTPLMILCESILLPNYQHAGKGDNHIYIYIYIRDIGSAIDYTQVVHFPIMLLRHKVEDIHQISSNAYDFVHSEK